MSEFKREDRYIVIKHSDISGFWREDVREQFFAALERLNEHQVRIPQRKFLVIESDWPEYGPTWKMIEDRVSGAPVEGGKAEYDALAAAMTTNQTIDRVPLAELKFDDRLFHVSKTWKGCGRGWVKFIRDEGDGCVRVRCENGAVPIVKLCNLQTLAVTDEQELAEFYDELSNGDALARRALTHIKALHLANKPAAQPQGEPVAILSGPDDSVCWTQDNTPKELRKQVVLIEHADFLRLQYLASSAAEAVHQVRWCSLGQWQEWKTVSREKYERSDGPLFERRIVYAEQPAPVAAAPINYGALDPVERLAVCRGER